MVKTSPSNVGGAGSVPGQGAKTPRDPRQEKSSKIHQTALTGTVNPVLGPDLPKHQCAKSRFFP